MLIKIDDGIDEVFFNPDAIVTIRFFDDKTVVTTTTGRVALQIGKEEFFSQYSSEVIL
jgi:hypothetical protein